MARSSSLSMAGLGVRRVLKAMTTTGNPLPSTQKTKMTRKRRGASMLVLSCPLCTFYASVQLLTCVAHGRRTSRDGLVAHGSCQGIR
jgi:hypothetical protein